MKFAIMLENGAEKPSILARKDGTELWFHSLQETLDFIKEYDIPIPTNGVINEFIGNFVLNKYDAPTIKDMLAHGIPAKQETAGEAQ